MKFNKILFLSTLCLSLSLSAMDRPEQAQEDLQLQNRLLARYRVPSSLRALCVEKVLQQKSYMSLKEFLQSDQPQLQQECNSLVAFQLLKKNPGISDILEKIEIPCLTLIVPNSFFNSFVITADGSKVVTGLRDDSIKVWDIKTGRCLVTRETQNKANWVVDDRHLETFEYKDWVLDYNNSDSNRTKMVSGSVGAPTIWNIKGNWLILRELGRHDFLRSVSMSPDGNRVVTGSEDKVKIWDISRLNTIYNQLQNLTIKQALLLKEWSPQTWQQTELTWQQTELKKILKKVSEKNNQALDFSCPLIKKIFEYHTLDVSNQQIKKVFDSLPEEIKEIIDLPASVRIFTYNNKKYALDLNECETFTVETFSELLDQGKQLIGVVSNGIVKFYDADKYAIYKALGNTTDPQTRRPIKEDFHIMVTEKEVKKK